MKKISMNLVFVAAVFFTIIKFENDIYNTSSYSFYPNITHVELVVESSATSLLQNFSPVLSSNSRQSHHSTFQYTSSYFLTDKSNFPLLPLHENFTDFQTSENQQNHILSILKKSNAWQKSGDDETPFLITIFS